MTFIQKGVGSIKDKYSYQKHECFDEASSLPESICIVETREGLAAISSPTTELVIWERSLPSHFQTWLEELEPSQLPNLRILVQPHDLPRALMQHFDNFDMPNEKMRGSLTSDIDRLVTVFARITRSAYVDVRLDRISHDACWKFHRDSVATRLLTTYRGPGTEGVQQQQAAHALRKQKDYKGPIELIERNDVAIFKGSCAGSGSGIVHRSPPIADTGCTRLLLCINTPSAVSPEKWSKPTELASI